MRGRGENSALTSPRPNRDARRRAEVQRRRGSAAPASTGGTPTLAMADALVAAGQFGAAFDVYEQLIDSPKDRAAARAAFGWFLVDHAPATPHPVVDAAFTRALNEGWLRPEALAAAVIRYLGAKWPGALALPADPARPAAAGLLGDPLLRALLLATPMATPALDILLAQWRQVLLAAAAAGQSIASHAGMLAALAIRNWHGGYALVLPGDRLETDDDAIAKIAASLAQPSNDLAARLALLACYTPPDRALIEPALRDPNASAIAALLMTWIIEPAARQQSIAAGLQPMTPLDASSALVATQYEDHPYPAWVAEPGSPIALPFAVIKALGPAGKKAPRHVLIAGCGTGQHAIAAARDWPRAKILAIDLSRSSLAYAIDKATQLGETRVSFGLADILHLPVLGQRFPVIEAVGVLHHLADPAAGLSALVACLEPGGLMRIALYARAARHRLVSVRTAFSGAGVTDHDVRRFRAWALANLDAPEILHSPDFYSIGGCRDLVFHVREHSFTLPEIATLVADAGLDFLALEMPPLPPALRAGPFPAATDIAGWDRMERSQPLLFGGMYHFWVRSRSVRR